MKNILAFLSLVAALIFAPSLTTPAAAQPCQWQYDLVPQSPAGTATATYCGNTVIKGNLTVNGVIANTVFPGVIFSSAYPTVALADADAVDKGYMLEIDQPFVLGADATLDAPEVYVDYAGSIVPGTHALTINGALYGPLDHQLIVPGSGTIAINGGNILYGTWFTGPWGNAAEDYQPGLQIAVNLVCRVNGNGPRILNLDGGALGSGSRGIYLNSTINMPANAQRCTIYDRGQSWTMNPNNTPFFYVTTANTGAKESTDWSILGDYSTNVTWTNTQSSVNTNAYFMITDGVTGGDGHRGIEIDGMQISNGGGLIRDAQTCGCLDGWWNSRITHITIIGPNVPAIWHNPNIGGSERQIYSQIVVTGPSAPASKIFDIEKVVQLNFSQWSIDNYGSGTPGYITPIDFQNDTNLNVSDWHIEVSTFNIQQVFNIYSSTGTICHGQFVNDTVFAGRSLSVFDVGGISIPSDIQICDIRAEQTTLQAGATAQVLNVPLANQGNKVTVDRNVKMDSAWTDFTQTSATANAEQIHQIGQQVLMKCYNTGITGTTAAISMTCENGVTTGLNAYTPLIVVGLSFWTNTIVAGTGSPSILIRVMSGATIITSAYIRPAQGMEGVILWEGTQAGNILPQGAPITVTYQATTLTSTNNLSVQLITK